jgi:phosphatidylserine/phosphatidylglycerophosphate/cardiolipin synthase-like enzyme
MRLMAAISTTTERIEWLVDNADAYRAFVRAIRGARRDIWLCQLAFDADCLAYEVFDDEHPARPEGTVLAKEMSEAAGRGVQLRILVNASLLLDTARSLRAYFADQKVEAECVRVRGINRFPQLLHAKMMIVDGEHAFLIGSPFANGYWDDARHAPEDSRRPSRELGGRPLHDLSIQLTGTAVHRLACTFAELWNHADDVVPGDAEHLHAPSHLPVADDDDSAIRVVRSAPRRSTPRHRDGRMEILPALLEGIARARGLIYIEHQYLSARPILAALVAALEREPQLEIVIVLNQNPDVTAYRGWQNARLRQAGLLDHPRVGLFTLWSAARAIESEGLRLNQVFVHSKLVAIEDRWATIGSANLDGVSLHSYGDDFDSALGRRLFRGVRNFDVNVVIDATEEPMAGSLQALRMGLWQEHLGARAEVPDATLEGGLLALWRSRARRNIVALNEVAAASLESTFVLPYSTCSTPRAQLADIGVLLAPGHIELCFEPSWLEVHFSPNWVRNMFA